jgi:MHS family proline/betaine transporter-like MFS transporter
VLIAGLTPTLAASLVESTQNLMMPAYYLMVIAVIGLITGVTMKETANRPLKGATPAASDIQEAKEILREHYDNVEQKIEDIDAEIEELQKKRSRLVDQHPRSVSNKKTRRWRVFFISIRRRCSRHWR